MFLSRLKISLALAVFLASSAAASQDASSGSTPVQQFAAWKLRAATGVPGATELAELEALFATVEADGSSTELLAELDKSRQALQKQLMPDSERPTATSAKAAAEKEVLRLALEKAIAEGNGAFIESLGTHAVPALKEMAAAWDGSPTRKGEEPALLWLSWASASDGLDVALELMGSKSFLIKRGTMWVLNRSQPFRDRHVWRPEGETNWRLARPEWEQILHRAFQEPALDPHDLRSVMEDFVESGQLPRSLGDAAIEASVPFNSRAVIPDDGLWYLELTASSPNPDLRASAAPFVVASGGESLTLALAQDPDESVRRGLASKILGEELDRYADRATGTIEYGFVPSVLTSVRFEALLALASDMSKDVNQGVRRSLSQYLDGTKSAPFSAEQLVSLFERVTDAALLSTLISTTQRLPEAERFNTVAAILQVLARRDAKTRVRLMGCLAPQSDANNAQLYPWVKALSEEERGQLIRAIYGNEAALKNDKLIASCNAAGFNGLIEARAVLTELLFDESAPSGARLWATRTLIAYHQDSIRTPELTAMARLVASAKSVPEASTLSRRFRDGRAQEFVRLLASEPEATPEQLLGIQPREIDPATLDVLWPRVADVAWADLSGELNAVWGIISVLAELSTEALDPRFEQVDFSIRRAREALFSAARKSRNPVLLPLIRRVMELPDYRQPAEWRDVTSAVAAYMNDDAAELLLDLARMAPGTERRGYALAALDEITQWRAAAAAWQKSKSSAAKRSQAIAELVAILDDASQPAESRAAAIRGLGLLQAVEELPRIVRSLNETDKALREAARAAMERMEK